MNNNLFVNELIEWNSGSENQLIERIVWVDEGYIIAFVFDINAKKGFPQPKKVSEILEAISMGLAFKQQQDSWARIVRDENLRDREKKYRDKAWGIIEEIVVQEPSIYYSNERGYLVKQVVEKYNVGRSKDKLTEKIVYGYLRRYWQRGKTPNALIPDYINSTGKGKIRGYREDKKRGRPRKYGYDPEIGEGINVTEEDRRIFKIARARFYDNSKQNSWITAYESMTKEFYNEEIKYDKKGAKKSILIPSNKIPTLTQFKYWSKLEHDDVTKTLTSRKGAKQFALEHRAITGTSKMETIGPGSRYQIDATIADVYLVSKYNRTWIIGRPVIYIIIDVFSRMIAGVYVGLEGPSWIGAMMALVNAATNKVKFCQEYGIEITEEEWLCHHIPDAILGDRGELIGMTVEKGFIPNLHVRIENAASYRADWKGLVERHFRTIHGYVKPFLPGYVDTDFRKRGGKDYRLDGRLDIEQFTEIVIHVIRYHNNHFLSKYERDAAMIADDVPPIPRELWKWGIANRSGRLRTFPEDIVKLNLMPTEKATVTAKGIKLRGKEMYYTCEKAAREQWFERARSNLLSQSEKYLTITYDIRRPNFIYLPSPDGRDFEKCYLLDPEGRYYDKNFQDIEYMLAYEEQQQQKYRGQNLQHKVDLMAEIESVAERATKMTDADLNNTTVSDRQRVTGIRDNRAFEKDERRKSEGFELGKTETRNPESAVDTKPKDSQQQKSLQPDYFDILSQNREELKRGQE
jgi:hypothetical protein